MVIFLWFDSSISDNEEKIEEILTTFGEKYRSLITTIIEEDCNEEHSPSHEQQKRTTIEVHRKNFARTFFRQMTDQQTKEKWSSRDSMWFVRYILILK